MRGRYLEITFRRGQPLAAYLCLPRPAGARAAKTLRAREGLLVDFAEDGTPIGIEIAAPSETSFEQINAVLAELGLESAGPDELAPLHCS